jgi:TPR repeat protein
VLREVFAKTETPLGWYLAGLFSHGREEFDFFKKSAEGGCSWGQAEYARHLKWGKFVEKDEKVHVEWLEKAVNQKNPDAMHKLGSWFRFKGGNDQERAVSYHRAGADLGWRMCMWNLALMLHGGEGCAKDLRQAVIMAVKGDAGGVFRVGLRDARQALEKGTTEDLGCDFDH